MKHRKFQIFTAIFVPILVIAGVVVGIVSNEQSTLMMSLILGGLYIFYLVRLIPMLKKEKTEQSKQTSPLRRR